MINFTKDTTEKSSVDKLHAFCHLIDSFKIFQQVIIQCVFAVKAFIMLYRRAIFFRLKLD